jgi:hypothetical protein
MALSVLFILAVGGIATSVALWIKCNSLTALNRKQLRAEQEKTNCLTRAMSANFSHVLGRITDSYDLECKYSGSETAWVVTLRGHEIAHFQLEEVIIRCHQGPTRKNMILIDAEGLFCYHYLEQYRSAIQKGIESELQQLRQTLQSI